nr:reverse transcriptase domain-containing protein [Tanacetum cinerariifolium]
MNGWLIEDEDKPLEHEASDKEVDSDLESTASRSISLDSSNDFTKYLLDILVFSTLHDDSKMEVIQAYDTIPPPQVVIALPSILPQSLVLSLSPMFDSQDLFPSKEISPKDTETPVELLIPLFPYLSLEVLNSKITVISCNVITRKHTRIYTMSNDFNTTRVVQRKCGRLITHKSHKFEVFHPSRRVKGGNYNYVTLESSHIKRYIAGLAPEIRGMLRATQPTTIQSKTLRAGILIDEAVSCGTLTKGNEKRKGVEESSKPGGGRNENKRAK